MQVSSQVRGWVGSTHVSCSVAFLNVKNPGLGSALVTYINSNRDAGTSGDADRGHFRFRHFKNSGINLRFLDGHPEAVRFLDMSAEFQHALGKVKTELYDKDQLHLAGPGYEAWARLMQPLFGELLGAAQSE